MILPNSQTKKFKTFSPTPGADASANQSTSLTLCTDFYQLSMLEAYYKNNMHETAVFEFFVRKLPDCRNFLVAAGLEQVIQYLQKLTFSEADIDYLKSLGKFDTNFIKYLRNFKFIGDVHAMPEGNIFFENEPIIQVTAPLPIAQFVESRVINILHFQTMIASKAARFKIASPDALLMDFGMRRAHGQEAALFAARASYIAGFNCTSMVEAGQQFSIPVFGTMAHSFIEAHGSELNAFTNFSFSRPQELVLLIDTYDVNRAVSNIIEMQPLLNNNCINIKAVRIDSGDLHKTIVSVRKQLNEAGLFEIKIVASGNLDEYKIQKLITKQVPVDGFGIGTLMTTSSDAPYLDCAYKLQEYAGIARRKRSTGKSTWPGAKQVYRTQLNGTISNDQITLKEEQANGTPLLKKVMEAGNPLSYPESLSDIRARFNQNLTNLPKNLLSLDSHYPYTVDISAKIRNLASDIDSFIK